MRYNVHLYTQVRIKVIGVEAENPSEAMQQADEAVNYQALLNNPNLTRVGGGLTVEHVEWAEGITECAVVDPVSASGKVDFDHSVCLDCEGKPPRAAANPVADEDPAVQATPSPC